MSKSEKSIIKCDIYDLANLAIETNKTIKECIDELEEDGKFKIYVLRAEIIHATSNRMCKCIIQFFNEVSMKGVIQIRMNDKTKVELKEWLETIPSQFYRFTIPICDPNVKYKLSVKDITRLSAVETEITLKNIMEPKDLDAVFAEITGRIPFNSLKYTISNFYTEYLDWAKTKILYKIVKGDKDIPKFLDYVECENNYIDDIVTCLNKHKLDVDSLVCYHASYTLKESDIDLIKSKLIVNNYDKVLQENELLKKQIEAVRKLM